MNKSKNPNFFTYLVSLTLIALVAIFATPANSEKEDLNQVHAASTPVQELNVNSLQTFQGEFNKQLFPQMLQMERFIRSTAGATTHDNVAQIGTLITIIEDKVVETPAIEEQPQPVVVEQKNHYIVSAFYLNVRKEGNSKSKIIDVLEKGDIVEIEGDTDKTWLKLKSGGYIHSKYAQPHTDSTKKVSDTLVSQTPIKVTTTSIKSDTNKITTLSYTPEKSSDNSITNPVKHGVDTASNLTVEDLKIILEGTELEGIEEAVIQIERDYNINALFTIAVAKLESGNGKSRIAKDKNNLFGLNAIDGNAYQKAFTYDTKSDSVLAFGKIIDNKYVGKGRTTLSEINSIYSSSSEWKRKVAEIINGDLRKI